MKKLLIGLGAILLLLAMAVVPDKGTAIWYFNGAPDVTPNISTSPELAFDYTNKELYNYDRVGLTWERYGRIKYGNGAPSGDGTLYKGWYDKDTGEWYKHTSGSIWLKTGGIQIDPTTDPILEETVDGVKINWALLSAVGVDSIRNKAVFRLADSDTTVLVKGRALFAFSSPAFEQKLFQAGTDDWTMFTTFRPIRMQEQEVDSLVQSVINTPIAINRLSEAINFKPKRDTVINSSGQDIFVTYSGSLPTFTGSNGSFTLTFPTGTEPNSWRFGGGSGESIWDGNGDMVIDVAFGGDLNNNDIDEYFAAIQLTNKENNEVIMDPKGQLGVGVFQQRISGNKIRLSMNNMTSFGEDGLKIVATY